MMERTLCVWFPEWALRRSSAQLDEPHQAIGEDSRVVAVNQAASRAGVRTGMQRREAEGVCPQIVTVMTDQGADAVDFEPVVAAVESLIPKVEVLVPGLLLAPVDGAVGYFGGEPSLVERVAVEVEAIAGAGFRLGIAAGPFAAQQAAKATTVEQPRRVVNDDAAFLGSLDVEILDEGFAATLRWLGVTTLGELSRLPRATVVSRFGGMGLAAHRLASGDDRSTRPRQIPRDWCMAENFSPPLENLEQASFVARALANRLMGRLAVEGVAPHRVEIVAQAADGRTRRRTWTSVDPFDDTMVAERVRWQLRAWLDAEQRGSGPGIRGGLVRLEILPRDLSDAGRQLALSDDASRMAETERTFAEAQALLGPQGVLQARPQGGRHPGERVTWYRWGEQPSAPQRDPDAPWPGSLPSPSPSLVPPLPPLLEVEWDQGTPHRVRLRSRWVPVISWAGPWRLVGRWWDGDASADRYQLVTSAGAFLCEVREGKTYLTGVYD